jgi:TPP-dependent pyruvate/acetoin dehydrogenase alpha subunit
LVYSIKKITSIFSTCSLIRHVETEISKRYKENEMRCPVHLSIGQEIVPSILSINLAKKDYVVSTHRSHAHYIAKGGNLKKMIAEIYGKITGCSKGNGGSMHLIDKSKNFMGSTSIVGNSIPIGTGLALSSKIRKKKQIAVIYLGDGATEQGSFFESLNFSALKKIPALYICENNFFSVYSDLKSRQPVNRNLKRLVESLGLNSYAFNNLNKFSTYKKIENIIQQVRQKSLPAFIEFKTYRYHEHCGPEIDDQLNYRNSGEIKYWKKKDSYTFLKKFLTKKIGQKNVKNIEKKIIKKINNAFNFAKKSRFPKKKEMFKNIYK